jgi:hypothetical protein
LFRISTGNRGTFPLEVAESKDRGNMGLPWEKGGVEVESMGLGCAGAHDNNGASLNASRSHSGGAAAAVGPNAAAGAFAMTATPVRRQRGQWGKQPVTPPPHKPATAAAQSIASCATEVTLLEAGASASASAADAAEVEAEEAEAEARRCESAAVEAEAEADAVAAEAAEALALWRARQEATAALAAEAQGMEDELRDAEAVLAEVPYPFLLPPFNGIACSF